MSFFENQDRARKKTGLLVFYFCTAVLLIIAAVNIAIYFILFLANQQKFSFGYWLTTGTCWWIALATLIIIAGGSLVRMAQLGKGGVSVALMAGGTPLNPDTSDHQERTLINVIEEMAIASGSHVPRVFIMREEEGINAFVAGPQANNTVLAITQGALDKLTRDELQGVIGHEFSHILNGDMSLNVRLLGILGGILMIGQIGEFLMRGNRSQIVLHGSSRRIGNKLMPLALVLIVVGYIGLFFGRLIKAAISRQREFLADASSVQFTRSPEGIASALYAIQYHAGQGFLMNRHAEDMSHMCFGDSVKVRMSRILATHPPIEDRIRSIDPGLLPRLKARFKKRSESGHLKAGRARGYSQSPLQPEADNQFQPDNITALVNANTSSLSPEAIAASMKDSVGHPTPDHHYYAHSLHQGFHQGLRETAHNPKLAPVILYGLLLTETKLTSTAPPVIKILEQDDHWTRLGEHTQAFQAIVNELPVEYRLPLLEIAINTLKTSPPEIRKQVIETCFLLIKADQRITLSEFVFTYLVKQGLSEIRRPPRNIYSLTKAEDALGTLFNALVKSSGESAERQKQNLTAIMGNFSEQDASHFLNTTPSAMGLNTALERLNRLTPLLKEPVVNACVDCILHDKKAVIKEIELLRAVCAALDCPMPPVLEHH